MEAKISIIMPVYNTDKFLHRSIKSIINQTYKYWELILIDDGSTDGSSYICDCYAACDNRIKVIHKKNEGVAIARQIGINIAKGEYSIHCDSDDWVEPHMIEELYKQAKAIDADIVIADYFVNKEKSQTVSKQTPTSLHGYDILLDLLNNKLFGSLCNKLIRNELYRKNNIIFWDNINHCEDYLVCIQLFQLKNLKFSYISKAFYHYYCNENSLTHNFTRETYDMRIKFRNKLQEILVIPQAKDICEQISFSIYSEAIIHRVLSKKEIKDGLKAYKYQIKRIKSFRWKIGFNFLTIGLNRIAYLFIHY